MPQNHLLSLALHNIFCSPLKFTGWDSRSRQKSSKVDWFRVTFSFALSSDGFTQPLPLTLLHGHWKRRRCNWCLLSSEPTHIPMSYLQLKSSCVPSRNQVRELHKSGIFSIWVCIVPGALPTEKSIPWEGQMVWILSNSCGKAMLGNEHPKCYLLNSLELIYKSGGPGLSGWMEEAHIYYTEVLVLVRKGGFI